MIDRHLAPPPLSLQILSCFGMKKLFRRVPPPLRSRYALAAISLLIWVLAFDRNDAWTTFQNRRELSRMRDQQQWYQEEIARTREQLHELSSNKELLEKFAREKYLMKRDNEDIFVLVPEKK